MALLYFYVKHHVDDHRNRLNSTPASYSGRPGFKSCPGDCIFWYFYWFSSVTPGKCREVHQTGALLHSTTPLLIYWCACAYLLLINDAISSSHCPTSTGKMICEFWIAKCAKRSWANSESLSWHVSAGTGENNEKPFRIDGTSAEIWSGHHLDTRQKRYRLCQLGHSFCSICINYSNIRRDVVWNTDSIIKQTGARIA
jgi:hypothetical protein